MSTRSITGDRLMAAVMFADMVGYTAMINEDEAHARSCKQRFREVVEDKVSLDHGKVIEFYGDGALIIFSSVIDAVVCARNIQQNLILEPFVPVRIGLHLGDIAYEKDGGIVGEAVNIASRLESVAIPQSVLISRKVAAELRNHTATVVRFLGNFNLKGIKEEVGIFALEDPSLKVPTIAEMEGKGELSLSSLAVLPFLNISTDPENEYFSDGITEEILNALVKVEGLKVTSRTSSFAFKKTDQTLKSIATQLGVQTILEGSVRKVGAQVRITAQLINARNDVHIWSETYDRTLEDIFAVQDEIAREIAHKLQSLFGVRKPAGQLVDVPTENIDAYETFLRGLYFQNKFTPPDAFRAIELFHRANELDPDFYLPLSNLAGEYAFLGSMGAMDACSAYKKGMQAAQTVLARDDSYAEAYASIALMHLFYDWDWKAVRSNLEEAEKLGASGTNFYITGYMFYGSQREFHEALQFLSRGLAQDPLNPMLLVLQAQGLMYLGEYEQSLQICKDLLVKIPDYRAAVELQGFIYMAMGDLEKALERFLTYQAMTGGPLKGISVLGYLYGILGQINKAEEILQKMKIRQELEPQSTFFLDFAMIYLGLGKIDECLNQLEEAFNNKIGAVIFFGIYPLWKPLRTNPRFLVMLKKLNLPARFK
ncbi:MAG: guanylate cyclase [Saprospiraceae bacterium]|nr:guanylate cyclase [Saprospiraceae bacterium]